MKAAADLPENLAIDLPNGISMRLVLIPGSYVMGSNDGFFDEGPASVQKVEKPFYMGQFEVTNLQYSAFDKNHSSGI
ncbi:MAG: SUMF1/EgtB/PvdO family nonheme iron enzyme [Bacilli bacterium]